MFKWISIVLMLGTLGQLAAQETEARSLRSFSEVRVSAGIVVELIASDQHHAFVETQKVSLDKLRTEVNGSVLKIFWDDVRSFSNNKQGHVSLQFVELSRLKASSGALISSEDCISSSEMKIQCSSGANLNLDIYAESLEVNVSSGGYVELKGIADKLDASVSSGAVIKARELIAQSADVSSSSGGSMQIFVNEKLDASASSGGAIRYDGDPKEKSLDVGKYSGGSVRKF